MQAHEIMIKEVFSVKETETVRSVIQIFLKNRISGLPVINDQKQIVGYISDGDILRYLGRETHRVIDSSFYITVIKGDCFSTKIEKLLNLNVMDLAVKKVIKVQWNEEVETIAAILGKKQIKKLPVERDGILVGIISRGDVIRNAFQALL